MRARSLFIGLAAALSAIGLPFRVAMAAPPAAPDSTDACIQASDEGQVLRDQGKLIEARSRFLTCARDACPRLVRTDCVAWLADAESRTPSVVLSAEDPAGHDTADVKVTLDGAPLSDHLEPRAIPVNPGPHRFRFTMGAEGAAQPLAVEVTVILREGEQRRAVAAHFNPGGEATPAPASARPTREVVGAAIALGAVAVVGGGLFAYLASSAQSTADTLRATCAPSCNPADVSAVRTKEIAANVSLGVGIGALATGLGVVLFGPREVPPPVSAAVVRVPGGSVFVLGGRF